jgi:ArsR family transcriptional regulator, nickel/cobalt-responsive transcriptional repressor
MTSMGHLGHNKPLALAPVDADLAAEVAETMQALATPSRVRILARLRQSPCSVGDLANEVELEQSAVSHQLRLLRHLGLVTGRRDGNRIIYSLHDDHVGDLVAQAIYHVEHIHLAAQQANAKRSTQTTPPKKPTRR